MPKRKPRKRKTTPWTPEIDKAVKQSKCDHAQWKAAGKPRDSSNLLHQNKILSKKALRSEQRKLEASLRNEKYKKIMELDETNGKEFYKLVKKQRDHSGSATTAMVFDKVLETDNDSITDGWAQYFEELATPINNRNFDQEYFNNTNKDISNLGNMFNEAPTNLIPSFTEDEGRKTVLSFKNGKSADEENITAEHLKYGGDILISIFTRLINFIFLKKN